MDFKTLIIILLVLGSAIGIGFGSYLNQKLIASEEIEVMSPGDLILVDIANARIAFDKALGLNDP
jgi:hypothetical protein